MDKTLENIENNTGTTEKKLGGVTGKGFMPGKSGNPGGRPKKPLKEFSMELFKSMTREEKLAFLEKISPLDRWKMTEGNPDQDTDITTSGESLNVLTPEQQAKLNELLK